MMVLVFSFKTSAPDSTVQSSVAVLAIRRDEETTINDNENAKIVTTHYTITTEWVVYWSRFSALDLIFF